MEQTAIQKKPLETLREALADSKLQEAIREVLPRHITSERICLVALNAASRNPVLLQCSPASIVKALLQAAELGLEPGSLIGGSHLVPYRNKHTGQYEAQCIVDYRGMIDLVRRSNCVSSIEARIVYIQDEFRISYGLSQNLVHIPKFVEDDTVRGVYAVARTHTGETQFEFMTKQEIDSIRARSRASDSGPWSTDYTEMARKTVVRKLFKYLPRSVEIQKALEYEAEADEGVASPFSIHSIIGDDVLAAEAKTATRTEEVREKIKGKIEKIMAPSAVAKSVEQDILNRPQPPSVESLPAAEVLAEKTHRPTIDEVKQAMKESEESEIDRLFVKLNYDENQITLTKTRYANRLPTELIDALKKAIRKREETAVSEQRR